MVSLKKNIFILILISVAVSCNNAKGHDNQEKAEVKQVTETPSRPNILFILCDDLGYSDVGFNGAKDIVTPTLDMLATNGTIFTDAYMAHPFCGPSRASLLTGRYSHKIGAQFNLPTEGDESKGVNENEIFLSKVLQESGYYTGAIGKWHLGYQTKYHPNQRGFDDFYGFLGGGHNYFPEQFKAAYNRQKASGRDFIWEYLRPLEHNGVAVDETEYVTDGLTREAVRFIGEAAAKKDKPFFLYLSYNAPHTPLEAKAEDLKLFQQIKDKKRRTYAAMVYAVDRGVKSIIDKLKKTNQYENTLIVFASDNGGKLKAGATNYPLKEGKGSAYEGGFRVPMFLHWPNVIPSGEKFNYPISSLDFYPTFVNLAKAQIPKNKKLDGVDIWASILNHSNPRVDKPIFVMRHRKGYSDVAIRKNEWKALKVHKQNWKLFNIEKDIEENHDLSDDYPSILKELVKEGEDWGKTHKQPEWFHIRKEGEQWRADNMPRFNETFSLTN